MYQVVFIRKKWDFLSLNLKLEIKSECQNLSDIVKNRKFQDVRLCLLKIAKETGEEESESIVDLEGLGFKISSDEAPAFRANQKAVWIYGPFDKSRYEKARAEFQFLAPPHLTYRYVQRTEIEGKLYLKYPQSVEKSLINEAIFETLKVEYKIKYDDFTEEGWKNLQSIDEWKRCETQILREIKAAELSKSYGFS